MSSILKSVTHISSPHLKNAAANFLQRFGSWCILHAGVQVHKVFSSALAACQKYDVLMACVQWSMNVKCKGCIHILQEPRSSGWHTSIGNMSSHSTRHALMFFWENVYLSGLNTCSGIIAFLIISFLPITFKVCVSYKVCFGNVSWN